MTQTAQAPLSQADRHLLFGGTSFVSRLTSTSTCVRWATSPSSEFVMRQVFWVRVCRIDLVKRCWHSSSRRRKHSALQRISEVVRGAMTDVICLQLAMLLLVSPSTTRLP